MNGISVLNKKTRTAPLPLPSHEDIGIEPSQDTKTASNLTLDFPRLKKQER